MALLTNQFKIEIFKKWNQLWWQVDLDTNHKIGKLCLKNVLYFEEINLN